MEAMSDKATPRPWRVKAALGPDRDFGIYREGHEGVLAECFEEFEARGVRKPGEAEANARMIVSAVNAYEAHQRAAEALRKLEDKLEELSPAIFAVTQYANVHGMVWSAGTWTNEREEARAALAELDKVVQP